MAKLIGTCSMEITPVASTCSGPSNHKIWINLAITATPDGIPASARDLQMNNNARGLANHPGLFEIIRTVNSAELSN